MVRTLIAIVVVSLVLGACAGTDGAATTTTTAAPATATRAPLRPDPFPTSTIEPLRALLFPPSPGTLLEVGHIYEYTMTVGCGGDLFFNDTWWVTTERFFAHPAYPAGWPVEIVNMGAVDGPDAYIEGLLELVDETHIEFRLADGTPVAVYEPGDPFFCG